METLKKRLIAMTFSLLIFMPMLGCNVKVETEVAAYETEYEADKTVNQQTNIEHTEEITTYKGDPSVVIDQVYTTDKAMSLTFNGLIEDEQMQHILEKLASHEISATFFLDQKHIRKYREVVDTIIKNGHAIESSIFNQQSLKNVSYEDIYNEVSDNNNLIEEIIGMKPTFTRTKPHKKSKKLQLITAQLNMEAVIGHSIRPRSKDLEDAGAMSNYFERALSRGGIISLDTKDYPHVLDSIDFIVEEANFLDYSIIPLASLVANGNVRIPFEEIEGHELIKKNLAYKKEKPNVFYSKDTDENIVALTFDDYGSDKTVSQILNILEKHQIKSTFFLKAKDVSKNPNLAKVILDEGHEIANHSYAHNRSTNLTPEELQDDLIKAHRIITEAIQEKPTMLFRPPFGNIDDDTAKVMSAVGFHNIAMYDVSSYDWNADYTVDDVLNRTMNGVEPGSVIVMHLSDNIKNLETLPIIIKRLASEGYSFVKMSEWFEE